jgi:hypothetical protein
MKVLRSPFQALGVPHDNSEMTITPDAFIHMAISFYSAHPEHYGDSAQSLEWSVANSLRNWMRKHKLCIKIENDKMLFVEDK